MSTIDENTITPSVDDLEALTQIGELLSEPGHLSLHTESGEAVDLPEQLRRLLDSATRSLRTGSSVTLMDHARMLSTQEAADILGVSRPTLVKLLESGQIPFTKVNSYRRVAMIDVIAFRTMQRAERLRIVEEAMHSNKMEGLPVTDAARSDAVAFVSGKIDEDELVRITRARYGIE
ncbi:DNA binding domain-containing protein, excisionase family [Promicromonospora umidemergens]|uniref:Excisionase family DNA binding protein n=1 Tax=Promicromonospora umidemergens TaxID=629679 RepID=A0ABP8X5N4_9MICO|nr:helix-turn-helix domain-containing protein [Promicromonospora umidemergens]MCP2285016.1 DNA binding domain-containing protein, excisionase family [Promicromonospora umidemergens]